MVSTTDLQNSERHSKRLKNILYLWTGNNHSGGTSGRGGGKEREGQFVLSNNKLYVYTLLCNTQVVLIFKLKSFVDKFSYFDLILIDLIKGVIYLPTERWRW